jgi:hypothetical protein
MANGRETAKVKMDIRVSSPPFVAKTLQLQRIDRVASAVKVRYTRLAHTISQEGRSQLLGLYMLSRAGIPVFPGVVHASGEVSCNHMFTQSGTVLQTSSSASFLGIPNSERSWSYATRVTCIPACSCRMCCSLHLPNMLAEHMAAAT